jgi:hypothetical protein
LNWEISLTSNFLWLWIVFFFLCVIWLPFPLCSTDWWLFILLPLFLVAYFFGILDKIFLKWRKVITIYKAKIRCIPVLDTRRCLTWTHMITLNYSVFSHCYWRGRVSVYVVSSVRAPLPTIHVILLYSYNCKALSFFFINQFSVEAFENLF